VPTIFTVLPGSWGWKDSDQVGCATNPHQLSFTKNRQLMLLTTKKPFDGPDGRPMSTVRYRVLETSPHLRMSIEGETRTTPSGDLVVWDLVMLSNDRYCWHRTDWPQGSCTKTNERCNPVTSQ
jgi:hypothetical protein